MPLWRETLHRPYEMWIGSVELARGRVLFWQEPSGTDGEDGRKTARPLGSWWAMPAFSVAD